MNLREKFNLYENIKSLIDENDGESIRRILRGYSGELKEFEQELGCLAVKRFRRGRDPIALHALSELGFNLLAHNGDDKSPLEELMDFHFFAQSREEEAAEAIRALLNSQCESFLPIIRQQNEGYAMWIEKLQKSFGPKKTRAKTARLVRALSPVLWTLFAAKLGLTI